MNTKELTNLEIFESRSLIHDELKSYELSFEKKWGFETIYSIPKLRLSGTNILEYLDVLETKHQGAKVKEMIFLAKRLKSLYEEEFKREQIKE